MLLTVLEQRYAHVSTSRQVGWRTTLPASPFQRPAPPEYYVTREVLRYLTHPLLLLPALLLTLSVPAKHLAISLNPSSSAMFLARFLVFVALSEPLLERFRCMWASA